MSEPPAASSSPGPPGPCLITGASGFIGGRLAARMAAEGRELRCLARATSNVSSLTAAGLPIVRGDLEDRESLAAAVAGCREVVHCGALVSDWATVAEIRTANVEGTRNMLTAAAHAGVERFVQISTTDVYGHRPQPERAETDPTEPDGRRFANWYAQSKLEAEHEVRAVGALGDLAAVILRPATVYGPGSDDVIGEIARAIRGGHMLLIGGGRTDAGLCYVENLLDAIVLALDSPEDIVDALDITDGLTITWRQLTSDLADGLGCRAPRLSLPYPLAGVIALVLEHGYRLLRDATGLTTPPLLSRQAVQVLGRDQSFSNLCARASLGWEPRVGYAEGLEATLQWLRGAPCGPR